MDYEQRRRMSEYLTMPALSQTAARQRQINAMPRDQLVAEARMLDPGMPASPEGPMGQSGSLGATIPPPMDLNEAFERVRQNPVKRTPIPDGMREQLMSANKATAALGAEGGNYEMLGPSRELNPVERQHALRGSKPYQDYLNAAMERHQAMKGGASVGFKGADLSPMPALNIYQSAGDPVRDGLDEDKFAAYKQRLADTAQERRDNRLAANPVYAASQREKMVQQLMKGGDGSNLTEVQRAALGLAPAPSLDPNVKYQSDQQLAIAKLQNDFKQAEQEREQMDAWRQRRVAFRAANGDDTEFQQFDPMPGAVSNVAAPVPGSGIGAYDRRLVDAAKDVSARGQAIPQIIERAIALAQTDPEQAKALLADANLTPDEIRQHVPWDPEKVSRLNSITEGGQYRWPMWTLPGMYNAVTGMENPFAGFGYDKIQPGMAAGHSTAPFAR